MQSPQSAKLSIAGGAIGLTGGLLAFNMHNKKVMCEASPEASEIKPTPVTQSDEDIEDLPESIVNYRHLGFGSVCGICCGVFLKKGAKILAFFIGAAFVFLQYMRSQGLIVVKWDNISRRYNASLKRKVGDNSTSDGVAVARVWNRLVDFLTADFQSRATFIAGLGLGLRLA
ncbi:hypothetical protein E3Q06_01414 [Wallemia mellicola]|nr:hypothetical protein E3Q21_01523 [Wallemia mellicola]TIB89808.1 hypothetical protein E3Q20_01500 [Wallemia mellicola]TIC41820.1 hypothetical protein E3Q07_01423 [Wallemia mellicola]TIC50409.1 hypothetical protein E3Q06_01414 [Wallemia mellicola]